MTREEFFRFLEEDRRKWEENEKKWDENQKVINRMLAHLTRHGDYIGSGVEGVAAILLPYYLEDRYGIEIKEMKKELMIVNGKKVEINLFAVAKRKRKKVAVLVECKATIGKGSVKDFLRKVRLVEPHLKDEGMEVLKIIFGTLIHPSAGRIARSKGIDMVSSVPQRI